MVFKFCMLSASCLIVVNALLNMLFLENLLDSVMKLMCQMFG